MRRAARVDGSHAEIAQALRDAGCGVLDLSRVAGGCPDLLACGPTHPFANVLLEVKNPAQPPNKQKLTPAQVKFHANWKGPKFVVKTVAEAFAAMGIH